VDLARYKQHAFGRARRTIGPHGYVAFFPSPLPRRVELSAETAAVMAEAESALGRLDGVSQLLPNPNLLVRPYVLREAVASTRIEGTRATIEDVYLADASDGVVTADVEEVVNSRTRGSSSSAAQSSTKPATRCGVPVLSSSSARTTAVASRCKPTSRPSSTRCSSRP
jgi:hypothetical protein